MRPRPVKTVLGLIALVTLAACSDSSSLEDAAGLYVLTRVGDVPTSEYVLPGADSQLRFEFDSLTLRADGTARSRARISGWIVNPETPYLSDITREFKWSRDGAFLVLASYCPPEQACIAMQHVRRMMWIDGTLRELAYGTEPFVYQGILDGPTAF